MCAQKNKKKTTTDSPAEQQPVAAVAAAVPQPENNWLKEETLKWIFSITGATALFYVIGKMIFASYHPDVKALIDMANQISFAGGARPEPVEGLLFRIGIFVLTLGTLGIYHLLSKTELAKKLSEGPAITAVGTTAVLAIALMIYLDFAAANPFAAGGPEQPQNSRDYIGKTNFEFYFNGIFLGNYLLLYIAILIPLLCGLFFVGIGKYEWDKKPLYQKLVNGVGYTVAGGTVLSIVAMNTFHFPYAFENKYDYNAIYYSMTQVYAGVPMLVDGFSNTYGLYPHFLNPLFQVIGLNVMKFSLVLSVITGLAFVLNFLFLQRLVQNRIILFLGFLTAIFFPYLDFKFLTDFDCSFAFYPVRYIVPSTLAFLATTYAYKKSAATYWATHIIMSSFILWNPEIGIVSFLSWMAFLTYHDFYSAEGRIQFKQIGLHWVFGILSVTAIIFLFKGIFYLGYGTPPDLSVLFGYMLIFGKVGVGLLPMALIHPWNIEALVVLLGFTYAIVKWYRKETSPRASIIFLTSVIALGFLVYFQGRSHNWPFAVSSGFCMLLLTIMGDELWTAIRKNSILPLQLLFGLFLLLISASFFEIVTNTDKIQTMVYQEEDKEKQAEEQQRVVANTDFILKNSVEKEKIFILTASQFEGLYFDGNKRQSAFNPGIAEMFLISDIDRMEQRMLDSSYSIFLDHHFGQYAFMPRILSAMGAAYDLAGSTPDISVYKKRTAPMPATSYFGQDGQVVIHRKYTNEAASQKTRARDGLGIGNPEIGPESSVEILFQSRKQLFSYATVIGNMNDTAGLVVAKIVNTDNYFFGANGKGITVPIPENQWAYCVMNIFPDRMELYVNGTPVGRLPLATPLKPSPERLHIGGFGFARNYIGVIAEACITNKTIDNTTITSRWQAISAGLPGK